MRAHKKKHRTEIRKENKQGEWSYHSFSPLFSLSISPLNIEQKKISVAFYSRVILI